MNSRLDLCWPCRGGEPADDIDVLGRCLGDDASFCGGRAMEKYYGPINGRDLGMTFPTELPLSNF